jgi:5'(3')-deoxyribonucleotidase
MLRTEFGYPHEGPLGLESTHWNSIQDHVDKKHWQWLWGSGVKNGLFRYGHLYKGSIEALRSLNEIGDVVIITHRPRSAVQDTLDWLSYLRLPFMEVHLLTNGEPKSSVPHCDMYVDDKPDNIIDFTDNTKGLPLLWARGWNTDMQVKDPGGVFKIVTKWGEVIDHAKELRR